jgi:ABC-type transport system involved in multi-copper enzyme maturation permease subunit
MRATWVTVWCAILGTAIFALAAGAIAGAMGDGDLVSSSELASFAVARASMAPLGVGLMSVVSVGGEYRHGTLLTTLLVTPRRSRVAAAYFAVNAVVAAVVAIVCAGLALTLSAMVFKGFSLGMLPLPSILGIIGVHVVYSVGWSVFGTSLALLLRSPSRALLVVIAWPLLVEPIVRSAATLTGGVVSDVAKFILPFSAGGTMQEISFTGARFLFAPADTSLSPALGGLIFTTELAILMGIAWIRFVRTSRAG